MAQLKRSSRARRTKLSAPRRKKLELALEQVENAELVRRLDGTDPTFSFKHALTQETAYLSLLLTRRRTLHNLVGQAYEQLEAADTDEIASLLAYHYGEAGQDEKTVVYSLRAARNAIGQNAYPEAAIHLYRAIGALRRLPDTTENRRLLVDAITSYLETAWGATMPREPFELASEGEALAHSLPDSDGTPGDKRRLARIQTMRAALHLARNQYPQVLEFTSAVLQEADQLADETLTITPSAQMGAVLTLQGHFDKAESYLERSRALSETSPDRWEWSWCVAFLAVGLAIRGWVQEAQRQIEQAIPLLQSRGNWVNLVQVLNFRLVILLQSGDLEQLVRESKNAVELAPATQLHLFAAIGAALEGLAYSRLGEHAAAASAMQASNAIAARIGGQPLMMFDWISAAQAEIAFNAGDWDAAIERAEQAVALASSVDGVFARGWAVRVLGQALAQHQVPDWKMVDAHLAESVRAFQECQAVFEIERTHSVWGQLLESRGDADAARQHFALAARHPEQSA